MRSDKEMRVWVIGTIVFGSVMLGWSSLAQVRRWAEEETHPNWFWAAYADLAQRLTRVETFLEEIEVSMSLLHTKMEMLIMQRAIEAREARED